MLSIAPKSPAYNLELYPSSDGKPMAENTEQYRWIALIKENLEVVLQGTESFIAADLLWYPEVAKPPAPAPSQAPDVMVVLGRPPGRRYSYQQWEEDNKAPQVVFEILSPSNKTKKGRQEMEAKFAFYQRYGVEEYYLYDPDALRAQAWIRQGKNLMPLDRLDQWVSPRLRIRFDWQLGQALKLYTPNGSLFKTLVDLQAEVERERLEKERERLEKERERLEKERERAEKERERAEKERLTAYLRSLGIDPDAIPR